MAKRILVLTGSPRQGGNSEALADAFIVGAKAAGNEVIKLRAGRMKVSGCADCKHCFNHQGACVQQDDMNEIYDALAEADIVVFATPLYFYGFTAQLKAVIDRLYAKVFAPVKVTAAVLFAVAADEEAEAFAPLVAHYQAIVKYLAWEDKGTITVGSVEARGDISGHEALDTARRLGESI